MKNRLFPVISGILILSGISMPSISYSQNQKTVKQFLTSLPSGKPDNNGILRKYKMSAVYTNLDLYGNFNSKTLVTGYYTEGSKNNTVTWNNVFIAGSNEKTVHFSEGKKQDYMENITYIPSSKMLEIETFKNFPVNTENIFARNLIWDMMSIEMFAWD